MFHFYINIIVEFRLLLNRDVLSRREWLVELLSTFNDVQSAIIQGVPIRVELGPKDMAKGQIVAVRRLNGEKLTLKRAGAAKELSELLEKTHKDMYDK